MRGADEMRDKITTLIKDAAPRKIPLLRDTWGLDQDALPDIGLVRSGEAPADALTASEAASQVWVLNPRLLKTDMVDIDQYGQPIYNARYACQIYVWTQNADTDGAIAARDHLAVVVRLCLLEWLNLEYGTYGNTNFRVHRDTYTEQFGDPHRISNRAGGRVWCPAVLAIDVDREDSLHDGSLRAPLGTADAVSPTVTAVGPNQPMPGG